jgi:beta-lactamase regulating signal transducer with metallopeptidase domain
MKAGRRMGMIDLLFQIALNNVCISLALAIAAVIVGITIRRPAITYLMWLLVFVKLLTPPVVTIPVLPGSWMSNAAPLNNLNIYEQRDMQEVRVHEYAGSAYRSTSTGSTILDQGKQWLFLTWLLGSMVVFLWSLHRVYYFNRLLERESEMGTQEIQATFREIASFLGIKTIPAIYTISANLSPMVWWAGGKVRVIIPAALMKQMDSGQLRWILSHELAHVRRRDYMVRWIEWLACVCFWWNPVVWWARYNLRTNEELCCDALVLASLKPRPYVYGDSLLKAVEILARPAYRQPAMASGINGGDLLKRRVRMIVSKKHSRSNLRWLQVCILLGALIVLPLGLTKAQEGNENKPQKVDADRVEPQELEAAVRQKLEALQAGQISQKEAQKRLAELEQQLAQRSMNLDTTAHQLQELKTSVLQAQEAQKTRQISQKEAQKRLAELEQQLAQRSMNLDAAAHQLQETAGELSRKQAEMEALSETYQKKHAQLAALSETHTPAHPDVIRLSKELETLSAQLEKFRTVKIFKTTAPTARYAVLHPSTDYAAVLKAAVADGMLTEEYVEEKLAKLENAQFERYGRMLIDAVEAGNIPEEEAAARKAEYLELLNAMKEKRQLDLQEEE